MDILVEELQGSLWCAALLDGRLEGLEVDPPNEQVRWGAIYWAKIKTIDAGMDAAFLDLDGGNTGILFNKDVRVRDKNGKILKGDVPIGKRFTPGQRIAVQAKTAYLYRPEDDSLPGEHKFARMSMDITLPGRYMIYCPLMDDNRISTRIKNKVLREQLIAMMDALKDIDGCILRASAANTQTDILVREAKILKEAWEQMQKHMEGETALVMQGPGAIQRMLSDQAVHTIDRIEITTMEHFNFVEEWCSVFAPDLVTKIEPIELPDADIDLALFNYRDIMSQIQELFQHYVLLPGGGNIIIQDTAALTAIDVNKSSDKSAYLGINIEAAEEVARQIRLRNAGGIIAVDFLRMAGKREQTKLIKALEKFLNDDPCTVQIHGFTGAGLLEMTRARRTPSLIDRFQDNFLD